MSDRRCFLRVIGGGTLAFSAGCSAAPHEGPLLLTGAGGGGSGGSGVGGDGTATSSASSTSASESSSSQSSSSHASSTSSGGMCTAKPVGTKVNKLSAYAATGLHICTNLGVLIGRDAGGLYALSAVCTHQGCDMSMVDSSGAYGQVINGNMDIACLCHGSEFGPSGSVVNGPARRPLQAYALELGCDGYLYVNTSMPVASTVRLKA